MMLAGPTETSGMVLRLRVTIRMDTESSSTMKLNGTKRRRNCARSEESGAALPCSGISVRRLDHLNCLAVDIKANRIFFETTWAAGSPSKS